MSTENYTPTLVSVADHEAGFKDLQVTTRSGVTMEVRLKAPSRRRARGLGLELQEAGDPWPVVAACDPRRLQDEQVLTEAWLDTLEMASADLVETTAFCLTFGLGFQKKMEQGVAQEVRMALKGSPNAAP